MPQRHVEKVAVTVASVCHLALAVPSSQSHLCLIWKRDPHAAKRSWAGGTMIMDISQIRPLRWLGRLVVGIVGLYLLTQVIGRIMRRVRPGLTPLRAIPNLNMPLRWQFFGTPEQIL